VNVSDTAHTFTVTGQGIDIETMPGKTTKVDDRPAPRDLSVRLPLPRVDGHEGPDRRCAVYPARGVSFVTVESGTCWGRTVLDGFKGGGTSGLAELTARDQAAHPGSGELELRLEQHRTELTAYAYRMLGSGFEAEDAVQEAFLRAWKSFEQFEGRSSLRSWLYSIVTNVCLDMLGGRERRARPMELAPARSADTPLPEPLPENVWILPVPDDRVVPQSGDPSEVLEARESVRLAFVAALQHLPPRQRAVLILREVLRWKASEVAELLDTSVASVNSALQRARGTLESLEIEDAETLLPTDDEQRALLDRYVDAFERYDMESLTSLLREDATWSMPPYEMWLQTHDDIRTWCLGPGIGCRGSKLIALQANGMPAFGQYKPSPEGGLEPWSLQVLEVADGRITGISFFLDTERLFPQFGLPPRLDG
jgi:RNA polymerase sigma-70 factor (ECF subfamily)